jgi:hypothetical protein
MGEHVTSITGTTAARTYHLDKSCPRLGWDDKPDSAACLIAELEHCGQPTGELFCYTHLWVVGVVTEP